MEPGAIRLVLKEAEPRKTLAAVAYREEWEIERVIKQTEKVPYEIIYRVEGSDTRIHYTEDFIIKLAYVTLVGSRGPQVADVIRRRMHVFSVDEILEEAQRAKTRDDWIYVVYELGAAAPAEPDPRIVKVFDRALHHEDPDVRRAAIVATGYAEYTEFRPILERVMADDPDAEVRQFARLALEGLQKIWSERSA